ncbi:Putative molybdenum transport system permease protein YvgM [Flagellimonas maritima]|uniref:Molybdenum transport system permease n=1 Tax=Flagellimonas maritima TaxID=1383885 RepID=A0A2Z4LQQ3_9FLAO|nr:molybdate ABC transporter permease subunit [Allomuricauda aurantiaca]AWX43884.1 Putative molybdenum transport system permease protein YvgM [Allomuricauda aurantiaca]
MIDWNPLLLTFELAIATTVILLILSIPLAYWLSNTKTRFKAIVETLVSMPLVLPPTVIGFYFLMAFSPNNFFGEWINEWLGITLVFSFPGLVIASIIYSLPFMVHPIQSGLSNLPKSIQEAAYVMGKSKLTTLFRIQLPNIKTSLLTGIVLSFAHTVGEFGVVLMIGGNIPGRTKVASIAIYDEVEALNYEAANLYSIILFAITFCILLAVYLKTGKHLNKLGR